MPIVMLSTTSDIMRPDQDSCFSLGAVQSGLPCIQRSGGPIRRLCRLPSLHEAPRWAVGPQTGGKNEHACSN
jgi:hypothetical protein